MATSALLNWNVNLQAAERWQLVLKETVNSPYSETRHNALKQIDSSSESGLKAIWSVLDKLSPKDPLKYDWYVREGAYDALAKAKGEEAIEEIERLLGSSRSTYSKEAIVYSVIWKIRKQFVDDYGGNDDRKREEAKYLLRKTRGVDYFKLVLPTIRKLDRKGRRFKWIKTAFQDKSARVRVAAINGFMAYPHNSSIPLLLGNLEKLADKKEKNLKEWVFTRHALETLTGRYYRDSVDDWLAWWDIDKDKFSIKKRIKKEAGKKKKKKNTRTEVVETQGLEVRLNMKVAGRGYPLLVLPWRGYEPDYFRPYFHSIEEFLKVYYVQIPQVEDFKGLKRRAEFNLVVYPTDQLAEALAKIMKESGPERFAIMGHGPAASTLAMTVAAKFRDRVSHLIMINPTSAGKEFRTALKTVEAKGRDLKSKELENGAKNSRLQPDGKPSYEPADAAEQAGMGRALYNVKFANPASPEVGALKFLYSLPGGTQVLNDSKWTLGTIFNHEPPKMPILVMQGAKDPWAPVFGVSKVTGYLKGCNVVKFSRSAQSPFMFETQRFTSALRAFCAKNGVETAKKAKKQKKQKKRSRTKSKKGRTVSKKG